MHIPQRSSSWFDCGGWGGSPFRGLPCQRIRAKHAQRGIAISAVPRLAGEQFGWASTSSKKAGTLWVNPARFRTGAGISNGASAGDRRGESSGRDREDAALAKWRLWLFTRNTALFLCKHHKTIAQKPGINIGATPGGDLPRGLHSDMRIQSLCSVWRKHRRQSQSATLFTGTKAAWSPNLPLPGGKGRSRGNKVILR